MHVGQTGSSFVTCFRVIPAKFSNTFYCERHKGEVYIAQQSFTSCAKQIYIIGREVEVKLG